MGNTKKPKLSITINRRHWLRGNKYAAKSMLYNPDKDRGCCLGHAMHQLCGIPWKNLKGFSMPGQYIRGREYVTGLNHFTDRHGSNTSFSHEAASINDASVITDDERESRLINLFKKNGIKLTFKGH